MTYQIIYSSESTTPMHSDDLQELLVSARKKNAAQGISGALVYAEGIFLQILEGESAPVQALMSRIRQDVRHENVIVLREGEVASAKFGHWNMAYVGATPAQIARWAGIGSADKETAATIDDELDRHRTAQFAQDILSLLASGDSAAKSQ